MRPIVFREEQLVSFVRFVQFVSDVLGPSQLPLTSPFDL
jgi:hypothetical protein